MRPSTPVAYVGAGFHHQAGPSSPPATPTTPTSAAHPLSTTESPLANHQRRRNFSRPLASQPRGSENRYAPLIWQDIGRAEGGGYIQALPGTNQFSYVPASHGRPDDPSLSPRSSSPEPSEDDDDDASSVSPRSITDDEDFITRESLPSPGFKTKRPGKGVWDEITDEDGDIDLDDEKRKKYDRGRRRRSTIKETNFILEEMPSRSQERNPDHHTLAIIQPDQYSDADTVPSRDRSIDINPSIIFSNSIIINDLPPSIPQSFPSHHEPNVVETDTTDTDTQSPLDPKILTQMSTLTCNSSSDHDAWLRRRRQEKRQKRWSLGSQKRSITQSIGSGTDEEDLHGDAVSVVGGGGGDEGGVGVGVSARRLRRKTGG